MAYSKVAYTGNGATTDFTFSFPYLNKAHVSVSVNGVATSFTWIGTSTVRVSPAPANGASILITRNSNRQARIANYQDAQMLTESDMDSDALQLFYVAQEAFDAVADAAAGGDMRRSFNLSDVNDLNAARLNIGALSRFGDTILGPLYLSESPSLPNQAASKAYVDSLLGFIGTGVSAFNGRVGAVVLAGSDVTGALGYTPMNKAGDTMTGPLVLAADPVSGLQAATKQYVDAIIGAGGSTGEWVFRMPVSTATAAALLTKTVAPTSNAAGAANLATTRNGGQAMVNFAMQYKITAQTTTNSDIGFTSYVSAANMNGGGIIGVNTVAAGPAHRHRHAPIARPRRSRCRTRVGCRPDP
jgi:hypothetical protein